MGGFLSTEAVRYGVGRGLFSHEAGAGTAPMAHAVAENTPTAQGVLGMVEVFVDTFVFCSATALPLLLAYPAQLPNEGGFVLGSVLLPRGRGSGAPAWRIHAAVRVCDAACLVLLRTAGAGVFYTARGRIEGVFVPFLRDLLSR